MGCRLGGLGAILSTSAAKTSDMSPQETDDHNAYEFSTIQVIMKLEILNTTAQIFLSILTYLFCAGLKLVEA